MNGTIRTAECVTPRHPDKLCDRISDAILDDALRQDSFSRVAVETMGGHGIITVTGEMTTRGYVDVPRIVDTIMLEGRHPQDVEHKGYGVQVNIARQSPEIAQGVDTGGAGDQGIMVGYATNETENRMPLEYCLARDLCRWIYHSHPYDGKTQVTVLDGKVTHIVASFQCVRQSTLREMVMIWIGEMSKLRPDRFSSEIEIFANPAGDWLTGGFDADTGLTGRKLMVDNYGPRVAIGGGAYSGKDPSKVDRSAAYMARHIAKRYLEEIIGGDRDDGTSHHVYCHLAYAIGVAEPIQATITATEHVSGAVVKADVKAFFPEIDLTPNGIIGHFRLRSPIYSETAEWGHYGNAFAWEQSGFTPRSKI